MHSFVYAAALALASAEVTQVREYSGYDFQAYLTEFKKSYTGDELASRQSIFQGNMERVKAHNDEYQAGKHSWWAGVSDLTDWTPEEFKRLRSAKYAPSTGPVVKLSATTPNPASVDWHKKGAVTAVKNQGGCGSCWAFSATESMESHYQIAGGPLLDLSPQTYVNCVKNPDGCGGTGGCEGATMELAFNMTMQTGIALEADLPYAGRDETCSNYKAAVKCAGYVKNPTNDAAALETAVATKGPQSITVAAGAWQLYGGGLFHGCSHGFMGHQDNTLDHGVQLVGYTQDAWIVRNSWGPSWGEKGYIRIQRATDNKTFIDHSPADGVACKPNPKSQTVGGECGILFDTSYPTGVTASDLSVLV